MEYVGSLVYDRVLRKEDVRLVIYGNGILGRKLYDYLERNGKLDKLECFCDAKEALWGTLYKGVPIISPEEAMNQKRDCHFLTAGKYANEQVALLLDSGIRHIHMFLE